MPIRPSPMVSVETPETSRIGASTSEESGLHHAPTFGFSIGHDEGRAAGIPVERRPLSRRDVRNWTVASLVGSALFVVVAAGALSRGGTHETPSAHPPMRPDAVQAQAATAAPAVPKPTVIPLEALPIAKEESHRMAPAVPKKTAHRTSAPTHVALTTQPSSTTPTRPSKRTLLSSPAKTSVGTKATTASTKSAP